MKKLFLILLSFSLLLTDVRADQHGFALKETPNKSLDVLYHDKLVGSYMFGRDVSTPEKRIETFKPYLHIFDAEGANPITKGPGGLFPHHRAIFIGYDKVVVNGKTYDLWHMKDGDQVHQKFRTLMVGPKSASFTSVVNWNDLNKTTLLAEERTFTFLVPPAFAYAEVDMVSKLKPLVGDTQLDGEVEHAGIHFRPANEIDPKQTVYTFPKAKADPHTDVDYPWVGESFTLNGKPYNVIYLNSPDNPKDSAFSAYRDYGRVGAFFKSTVKKGDTLTLHVRFLVSEGKMPSAELIQKAYNDFTGKSDPVPEITVQKGQAMPPPDPTPTTPPAHP